MPGRHDEPSCPSVDGPQAPAIDASTGRVLGLELLVRGQEFNLVGGVVAS